MAWDDKHEACIHFELNIVGQSAEDLTFQSVLPDTVTDKISWLSAISLISSVFDNISSGENGILDPADHSRPVYERMVAYVIGLYVEWVSHCARQTEPAGTRPSPHCKEEWTHYVTARNVAEKSDLIFTITVVASP